MALAVSPLIYGVIIGFDIFMPLPIKFFSATTEKKYRSRVKLKLEKQMMVFWRQLVGYIGGRLLDDLRWVHDEVVDVVHPMCAFIRERDRAGKPDGPVSIARRCSGNPERQIA